MNKKFWEEYKQETEKSNICTKTKKITLYKDVEKSWQKTKEILYEFETMAKNLFKEKYKNYENALFILGENTLEERRRI